MDMDQAAVFLAGSILTALGFIVFVIAVVIINNILHKYWKPVSLFTPDSWKGFNPPILDKDVNEPTNTGVK
jgi:hypothetical protein